MRNSSVPIEWMAALYRSAQVEACTYIVEGSVGFSESARCVLDWTSGRLNPVDGRMNMSAGFFSKAVSFGD